MSGNTTLKNILDLDYVIKNTKNLPLKVELRKTSLKGIGIYAIKFIKKEEIIALYQVKVFREKKYESPTLNSYMIGVYSPSGYESKVWVGDIVPESLQPPVLHEDGKHYVPYWGYFSNEPSGNQKENSYMDMNIDEIYKNKKRLKEGDLIFYKLIATQNIKPGEEIVWCYGEEYGERDY